MKSEQLLAAFTPSIMSHETLEAIFVRREALASRMMDNLRTSASTRSKRHTLLVGPRGIGKTHLVSLIYHRVKSDAELSEGLRIAWLREEMWEVASYLDLLENIAAAIASEYKAETLTQSLTKLRALPSESAITCTERLIVDFLGARVLLLIVENLEDLFDAIGEMGQRQLRAFLQNFNNTILLSTTPSLFYGISDHDAPFFGFFNVTHLDELSLDDAVSLLEKIADLRTDKDLAAFLRTETGRDRLEAVQHLAGGHPRIWIFFAGIITEATLDSLVPAFLEMLDDLTPYYQSRMKELPPQQRKIVAFLCNRRGSIPVKDIAEACRLSQPAAGAQLHDLRKKGFVRSESVGRESWYELNEPLMRLVLEIKESRGKPVRLIVDFLRRWYSRIERRSKYAMIPEDACMTRQYVEAALNLRGFSEVEPVVRETTLDWSAADDLLEDGDCHKALAVIEDTIERAGKSVTAKDWMYHGRCLDNLQRHTEALESFDYAIGLDPKMASAYYNRGIVLRKLQRHAEALESYDRAIELDPDDASCNFNRGNILDNLERYIEALESYDRAIELDPKKASAYHNRAITLSKLQRYAEAIESFDRAIDLDSHIAAAYYNRGHLLGTQEHYVEALENFDQCIQIDTERVEAFINRGVVLYAMQHYPEALESLTKSLQINPGDVDAHYNRAIVLLALERWPDFVSDLTQALRASKPEHDEQWGYTRTYCQILFTNSKAQTLPERILTLAEIYRKYHILKWLGKGLTESLPSLFESGRTVELAEKWNAAWQAAGKGHADMEIPLRLLDAAVRWHKKPDRRILLGLPVEERSVLETLLPPQK